MGGTITGGKIFAAHSSNAETRMTVEYSYCRSITIEKTGQFRIVSNSKKQPDWHTGTGSLGGQNRVLGGQKRPGEPAIRAEAVKYKKADDKEKTSPSPSLSLSFITVAFKQC